MILILKIGINIVSTKLTKFMIKYLKILLFSYNIYKAKNQKKYNNSKITDFKRQYNNLKQHSCILIYKNYCRLNTATINLKNKSHHCFLNRYLSIQVNHFFRNSFLYHKIYTINNINLYTEFNIHIKIGTGLVTIIQLPVWLLLSNTQKTPTI